MVRILSITLAVMVAMALLVLVTPARRGSACCDTIYGVTPDTLFRFDSSTPGAVTTVGPLTGLQEGETIRAIDFRPATGELYGIGGTGRLYTIDTTSAVATQFFAPLALADPLDVSMDFDPTTDEIRVVSRAGENVRINAGTGEISAVDTSLAYAAGDPNVRLEPDVGSIAYTGNAASPSTTLFGIDDGLDILVRQGGVAGSPSPNTGQLSTVGSLGLVPSAEAAGFDVTASGTALAVFKVGTDGLYTVNLTTGAATLVGSIAAPAGVTDTAVQPPEPAPKPTPGPDAFGNVNCSGGINSVDALLILRSNAGLAVSQSEPCPDIGVDTLPNGELQGDVDCGASVNAVDALKLLRFVAGLPVSQNASCPGIGT